MAFQLCIREEVASASHDPPTLGVDHGEWAVSLSTSTNTTPSRIVLTDPFKDQQTFGVDPESAVRWYLERHTAEPFEKTKADFAAESLVAYGKSLATQIVKNISLPKRGHLDIELSKIAPPVSLQTLDVSTKNVARDLQQLHWEVLEDVRVWPAGYHFESVSIVRSIRKDPIVTVDNHVKSNRKEFKILLVVSRPEQSADLEYQLVSRCLVAIIEHISKSNPDVAPSLTLLRPPTWKAFCEHLKQGYDLVHLDMHGEIKNAATENPTSVLAFCRERLDNPLRYKKDLRTGREVGDALAASGVKTVVLNACSSATSQYSSTESNLAQILVNHGIESVLAMAYDVVEQAVEIFMNAFYQAILVNKTSVQVAARISRLALMQNRSRRAWCMHYVDLSDYIVPVYYTSRPMTDGSDLSAHSRSKTDLLSYTQKIMKSASFIFPSADAPVDSAYAKPQDLRGRDGDILSIEVLLTSSLLSKSRTILVHGQAGCGKTTLLRYLCQWWKISGWIQNSAYCDLAGLDCYPFGRILNSIGEQLHLDKGCRSRDEIIAKVREDKCLLVFDSEDSFGDPLQRSALTDAQSKPLYEELKSLIGEATCGGSIAIVSSRLPSSQIASISGEYQKYHLTGLSVLDSVDLLQQLTFTEESYVPQTYHRRENLDYLRRVAIILEGNPVALQMIVPPFKSANYEGENLFNTLLYGKCDFDKTAWETSRFVKSLWISYLDHSFTQFDESLIHLTTLGIFWTIVPRDLTYYYWFLTLPFSKYFQEGNYANWISKEFQDIVESAQMARNLHTYWPDIEDKMIRAGYISHATITRNGGAQVPCYHLHPIFTLIGRSWMSMLKQAKFAYVRHALLWEDRHIDEKLGHFLSVEWGGTMQHEDYLHNIRAMALQWSVEDGDLKEEYDRMGVSLFGCTYKVCIPSFYEGERQHTIFKPIIWRHLLRAHMLVHLVRPEGKPKKNEFYEIVSNSWALYRLETDPAQRAAIVSNALEVIDKYRGVEPAVSLLSPPLQLTWFQLRQAEASLANDANMVYKAKELYERNLADDPSENLPHDMYCAIRRTHHQSIVDWAGCVIDIALREDKLNKQDITDHIQAFRGTFRPGGMKSHLSKLITEYPDLLQNMTPRDQHRAAVDLEQAAVSNFGKLAKGILDLRFVDIFGDQLPADGLLQMFHKELGTGGPYSAQYSAVISNMESAVHTFAGDRSAAATALQSSIMQESLSSTSSTSWENLANLHKQLYALAVESSEEPDYKKGLAHLTEWWKLHNGINLGKLDLCAGLLNFATCYNAFNRISEAARSVIRCAQVIPTMTAADFPEDDDGSGYGEWLYEEFAKLEGLVVFQNQSTMFSKPSFAPDLTWLERVTIHLVIKKALEVKKEQEENRAAMQEWKENLERTEPLYKLAKRILEALGPEQQEQGEDGEKCNRTVEELE